MVRTLPKTYNVPSKSTPHVKPPCLNKRPEDSMTAIEDPTEEASNLEDTSGISSCFIGANVYWLTKESTAPATRTSFRPVIASAKLINPFTSLLVLLTTIPTPWLRIHATRSLLQLPSWNFETRRGIFPTKRQALTVSWSRT